MPETRVLFYRDDDGSVPVLEWLDDLYRQNRRAYKKCDELIALLATFGHELRRPVADMLQDGVYELRARVGRVHYRVLYFFHGRHIAVLAHALTKERAIPATVLKQALQRKKRFEADPEKYTYRE
jgi:phage-related protein